jgi:hypothetical protein
VAEFAFRGRPIPATLWTVAAELAREYGVFRTAKVLRLEYGKLKRQMTPAQPKARPISTTPPAFVELIAVWSKYWTDEPVCHHRPSV